MNGIVSKRSATYAVGVLAVAIAIAGCDAGADAVREASLVESNFPDWVRDDQSALRNQMDRARGRLWVLTSEGVDLYDATTRQKVAQIALPGWLWAGHKYSCPPDLAIGPRGEAVISSNVVPTLWRVDPVTLAASRHDLVVDEDKGRDIGFTALTYSAQLGAYFAVSPSQGSLWRIDPLLRRAQSILLSEPLPKACGLAIPPREPDRRASRFVGFCVRGEQGDSTVSLAPDQRSGYVRSAYCRS